MTDDKDFWKNAHWEDVGYTKPDTEFFPEGEDKISTVARDTFAYWGKPVPTTTIKLGTVPQEVLDLLFGKRDPMLELSEAVGFKRGSTGGFAVSDAEIEQLNFDLLVEFEQYLMVKAIEWGMVVSVWRTLWGKVIKWRPASFAPQPETQEEENP